MRRLGSVTERRFSLDLAAHLSAISAPPECGATWQLQTALAIADGAPIGGDFIVFSLDPAGHRLQAVLVDTSGKGAEAATRSVMLAGAISGLIGEVASTDLLPALNRHVMRLGSDENFATAVHLDLDLAGGGFRLGVAGHPAPAHFAAATGRWELLAATGPALGFLPDAQWGQHRGYLGANDALVLVTDGVVELAGQDLDLGLDRMLGHCERLVLSGFANGAEELLRQRRASNDDAQVCVVTRRLPPRTAAMTPG